MKKDETGKNIRALLGTTQEEMALLLLVTRSQYSLFELGKRDLPIEAKKKLSDMLSFVEKRKKSPKNGLQKNNDEEKKKIKLFKEEIQINHSQLLTLEKKLESLEKINNKSKATLILADYLEQSNDFGKDLANSFRYKANSDLKKSDTQIREKYKLKILALKSYNKELEKALKHIKSKK